MKRIVINVSPFPLFPGFFDKKIAEYQKKMSEKAKKH